MTNLRMVVPGDSSVGLPSSTVVVCPKCLEEFGDELKYPEGMLGEQYISYKSTTEEPCEMCPDRVGSSS